MFQHETMRDAWPSGAQGLSGDARGTEALSYKGRSSDIHREEIIIVGAGQAGLSMGYWLRKFQRSFLLLEAGPRLGESWRQRYDSLVLFTPRRYSALPGLALPGDPEGRPTKDELADYLQTYADHFALPVQTDTRVVCLQQQAETFLLHTTQGTYQATTSSWQRVRFTTHASRPSPRRSPRKCSSFTRPPTTTRQRFLRVLCWW